MNVTRENIDELNALLKVTVEAADYAQRVENTLTDYRKKAAIPGFRQGKVPMSFVKKQYGKAILAEELNKLVSDALFKYINDEKLDILGNPLPKDDSEVVGDFDNPGSFEFTYEIGLSPKLDISVSAKSKFEFTKVKIDDKLIDKQVNDFRRRYGKLVSGETVGETDLVLGQFVELDDKGEIKEGGILHSSTISMEFIEDKKTKKDLLGKKAGDKLVISAEKVSKGEADKAAMLGVKADQLATINDNFQFTINEIKVMELAELNQELFDKLFGPGSVSSEDEMRSRIAEDLKKMFEEDADKILARRITNDLMKNTSVNLPDDFLKRWILMSQKDDTITMDDVERDYKNYVKGLKWQLIQKEIFSANNLRLENEEVVEYTKGLLANQYAQYGIPTPEDTELTQSARGILSKREEAEKIYDMLAEVKLINFFKSTVKLTEKELAYDDYMKMAEEMMSQN
jgi:trigger factor